MYMLIFFPLQSQAACVVVPASAVMELVLMTVKLTAVFLVEVSMISISLSCN